jgi:tetratricopeptide (TPR) repeat protein
MHAERRVKSKRTASEHVQEKNTVNTKKRTTLPVWSGVVAVAVLLTAGAARAQDEGDAAPAAGGKESEMDREIRYATGLMDLGLPDFALTVMAEAEKKFPEAKAAAARIAVDSFASQGKFKPAEDELAKIPSNTVEHASAQLLIADRYYQFGHLKEAREGYEAVLGAYDKNGPPPELRKFYMDSAYKFSQMLLNRNDPRGAVRAMRYILSAKPDSYMRRTVETEMAELLLKVAEPLPPGADRKAVLKEATDLCNDVMWEQDILFGRAVVVLAHAKKLNENVAAARKLVADKLPMLEGMEQAIKDSVKENNPKVSPEVLASLTRDALRESPMAQCKYLMGTLHQEDGQAALAANKEPDAKEQFGAALGMFFTVVKNYPASTWGPDACQHIEEIMAIGKERNWGIEVPASVNMSAVLATRFKDAYSSFADSNYSEAAKYFLQALNVAPNYRDAAQAIGTLAQCYIHENNELYARTVIGYLAERYGRDSEKMPAAGNALLGVAQTYAAEGQGPRSREIYLLFTERFADHDQAPAVLTLLGDAALRVTNYVEAAIMYQKVAEKYNRPGRIYNDALNRLAICQTGLNDSSNAVATLKTYLGLLPENSEKITTLVRIGDAYRKMESWDFAAATYGTVIDLLGKPDAYAPTADDRERNRKSREAALFYRGYCYSRLKPAPDQVAAFQVKAIDSFNAFLKEYPDSELAPSVLSNIGTLLFLQNRVQEANDVFNTLDKKYPGKITSILYVQFMSLVDLGRFEKAAELADKMVAEGVKKYTPAQFITVGNRLLDEGRQPAAAQKAFELARGAVDPVKDHFLWEQASIGLGKALVAANQSASAAGPMNELLKRYPRGPYTAEANQVLGRAYLVQAVAANGLDKTNLFKKALGALATYRQYLKESGPVAEADMELAKIQLAMGEKRKTLATYQRVFDLQPGDLRTGVCVEDAFVNMVPMLLEDKRFDVALEAIDYYLKTFHKGKYVVDARMWRSQLPSDLVSRAEEAAAAVSPAPGAATPVAPVASTSAPAAAVAAPAPTKPAP